MFHSRLTQLMNDNNVNQSELARKIGVTDPAVQSWREGKSFPNIDRLKSLRKIFNVSIDYLLGLDVEDSIELIQSQKNKEISDKVKELRNSKGYNQKDFALSCNLSLKDVQEIESGRTPTIDELINITSLMRISLDEFIGKDDKTILEKQEHEKILKFALDLDNRDFIKIAMNLKESGISLDLFTKVFKV